MSNLKVLKFYIPEISVHMSIEEQLLDSIYLPEKLKNLHWHKYLLRTVPSNFKPRNLIELNLPFSKVVQIWEGQKVLFVLILKR